MDIEFLEDGRMMLTPVVRIPRHQMWAWTERVDRLLAEAASGKRTVTCVTEPGVLGDFAKSCGVII